MLWRCVYAVRQIALIWFVMLSAESNMIPRFRTCDDQLMVDPIKHHFFLHSAGFKCMFRQHIYVIPKWSSTVINAVTSYYLHMEHIYASSTSMRSIMMYMHVPIQIVVEWIQILEDAASLFSRRVLRLCGCSVDSFLELHVVCDYRLIIIRNFFHNWATISILIFVSIFVVMYDSFPIGCNDNTKSNCVMIVTIPWKVWILVLRTNW